MAENNLLQADVPVGASIIEQRRGTAPGLICPVTVTGEDGEPVEKVMYAVPGVPYEMTEMMERAILPDLRLRAGEPSTILSRTLRTWGDSESGLAERLADRIAELDERGNPTLAFLASGIEGLKVRITAKGPDEIACRELLAHEEGVLRALLGDIVFGVDDETMEIAVASLLDAKGLTLGLAESVTGGLLGARLTAAPGASTWFRGSVVSYASEVKYDLLGVPEGPVVSAPVGRGDGARGPQGARRRRRPGGHRGGRTGRPGGRRARHRVRRPRARRRGRVPRDAPARRPSAGAGVRGDHRARPAAPPSPRTGRRPA